MLQKNLNDVNDIVDNLILSQRYNNYKETLKFYVNKKNVNKRLEITNDILNKETLNNLIKQKIK